MTITVEPLTREAFAPFGDVIQTDGARNFSINAGTVERYHKLAAVDVGEEEQGRAIISIAECKAVSSLPCSLPLVERHPLGSQAFIPLDKQPIIVVVATKGETVDPRALKAFVSNGKQGINYHRGVWHMPLICLAERQQLLIVDRDGPGNNCEEFFFDEEIRIDGLQA
ncbi:MAG: ureidoglycolate lyase [Gammaproteobacteria bacterium]|nr:ureidoglycolate lyase [Gammaproteobacteria bacterium]